MSMSEQSKNSPTCIEVKGRTIEEESRKNDNNACENVAEKHWKVWWIVFFKIWSLFW